MAEVYQYDENVLGCFTDGLHYTGFENGAESQVAEEPFTVFGNTIQPGDIIKAFESGNSRTSFELKDAKLKYIGRFNGEVLFDVIEENPNPRQAGLFDRQTKWLLSFAYVGETAGLLMFSSNQACYDVRPHLIVR